MIKFYTNYDCPPEDCEYYKPGTSLTVPDQVEPVSVTVARCMRGEVLSLADQKPVYYELDGTESFDEAFDKLDQTSSPGFDLADVSSLLESASADRKAVGEESVTPKESKPAEATTSETQSTDVSNQSQE